MKNHHFSAPAPNYLVLMIQAVQKLKITVFSASTSSPFTFRDIFCDKPGRAAPSAAPCEETNGWKDESCFCEDSSGMVNRDSVVRVNRETFVVVNRDL